MDANRYVYVVELDCAVLQNKKFLSRNPSYKNGYQPLYVGMTGLTPELRFRNHKEGLKANKYVRQHGVRLRPDLYEKYNPLSYEKAVILEVTLAEDLRRKGHAVWQA
jgi:hypothetical protein